MRYAIASAWIVLLLLPFWLGQERLTLAQALDHPLQYLQQFRDTYRLSPPQSNAPKDVQIPISHWQSPQGVAHFSNLADTPAQARPIALSPVDNSDLMPSYSLSQNLLFLGSLLLLSALLASLMMLSLRYLWQRFHPVGVAQAAEPQPDTTRISEPVGNDPYRTLGVSSHDSDTTIRRAYYRLMARHHPDKTAHLDVRQQQHAQERSQIINAAWQQIRQQRRSPPTELS